jgi:hypothetical protein
MSLANLISGPPMMKNPSSMTAFEKKRNFLINQSDPLLLKELSYKKVTHSVFLLNALLFMNSDSDNEKIPVLLDRTVPEDENVVGQSDFLSSDHEIQGHPHRF